MKSGYLKGLQTISILLSLIFSLNRGAVAAQKPYLEFDSPPSNDPISQSWIKTIHQSADGFIWLGAANGLIRFDGYEYTYFIHQPNDSQSISNNWVTEILEDAQGWLWVATDGGGVNVFDPKHNRFWAFRHDPDEENSLSSDRILCAAFGSGNTLWLGTRSGGLNRLDRKTGKCIRYQHDPNNPNSLINNRVWAVYEDSLRAEVWIGTRGGLDLLDLQTGKFTHYRHDPANAQSLSNNFVMSITRDSRGRLWVGTRIGLNRLDTGDMGFTRFRYEKTNPNGLLNDYIFDVFEDSRQQIWIAALGGVGLWDNEKRQFLNFYTDPDNPKALHSGTVWEIMEDREGRLWMSTYGGGYSVLDQHRRKIDHYPLPLPDPAMKGKNTIFQIEEDKNGNLWIASYAGLHQFDPETRNFRYFCPDWIDPGRWSVWSMAQAPDGQLVLVSPFWQVGFNPSTGQFTPDYFKGQLPDGLITDIASDAMGNFWIFSNQTCKLYRKESGSSQWETIVFEESLTEVQATFLFIDSKNQLWIGTDGNGLLQYSPATKTVRQFVNDLEDPASLSSNFIASMEEDQEGNIWIGCRSGGLNLLLTGEGKGKFRQWTRSNTGLGADYVHSIQLDHYGTLWLGTDNGLFNFNPRTGKFDHYGTRDGLSSHSFDGGASWKTRANLLLLGSGNDLNVFHPDSILRNPFPPRVVITDFMLMSRSVPVRGTGSDTLHYVSPLLNSISYTDRIELEWWQNDLTFAFAALNYTLPEKNYYLYRLEGYQEDWVEASASERRAVYTNLDPGDYIFSVMGSNNDGIWNDEPTQIHILIRPPWWSTWWAYSIYSLVALGLISLYLNLLLMRRMAQSKASRLKDIDLAKTRLFTNISHEFRTPLTIIIGMTEQIRTNPGTWFREGLDLIRQNGRQLLSMVDQMLELRKLEAGAMPLHYRQGDIISFLRQLVEPFAWHAQTRQIQLHFLPEEKELRMDFDAEKLIRICSNLLSNAVKFTKPGGNIYVMTSCLEDKASPVFVLKVKDTGIGIASDQLPHIFNRFYQVPNGAPAEKNSGTGIGLALIDELVRLMDGTVSVQSELGEGTVFTVMLPIHRDAPAFEVNTPQELSKAVSEAAPFTTGQVSLSFSKDEADEHPLALLVDDNPDVLTYLRACLNEQYAIATAEDGAIGINRAIELIPDIIISDIMMPGTDGLELCRTLKKDERTNHIPIILLTAKADQPSRLAGLETGADSYITKPFDPEELRVRMRNLLAIREQVRQHYLNEPEEVASVAVDNSDKWQNDPFVARTKELIEAQIDNFDLKVHDLCKELHISHSQLHRKLTAVCGLSPNRFIRHIRLLHARKLLLDPELSITAVAYDCGFHDPDYFGRVFRETFGQTPSDFRDRHGILST